ncbi:MAG: alkaline phosphatase [Bacteroidetes bacterium]|nr:alkaline phosphatase [Bacteroidota bacterium]
MKQVIILLIGFYGFFGYVNGQNSDNPPVQAKNIILLIGDGMGVSQIYAAMIANHGHLSLEGFTHVGFSKTYSANDFITDSGAGGTAIATGYKTYDHAIGVDADTIPRASILEIAESNGKATGLVATSEITHATPASFIAHVPNRNDYEEIAKSFLETDIDVFIGGGYKYFADREDNRNLIDELQKKNYTVCTSTDQLKDVKTGKLAGLIYDDKPPRKRKGRDDMLMIATQKAIEILNQSESGFFLMIEGSQIDWGAHKNNTDYIIEEMLDFDAVVGAVLDFARHDGNTLVIVTADHETGGMSIMNGDFSTGEVSAKYSSFGHTGVMVPVFADGPGDDLFGGIYENTAIFEKMKLLFGFQ